MGKRIRAVCLFVLVLTALCGPGLAADIPSSVLETARSVYYVETSDAEYISSGTAFIIRTYTDAAFLITNYHVVEMNTDNISIWIGENEKIHAQLLRYSAEYDLALLKIPVRTGMRQMIFSGSYARGDSVYAIGFPAAADNLSSVAAHLSEDATITDGIISNIRTMQFVEFGPEVTILQINAALNSGNSGGPLVDKYGRVVGINTLGVQAAQGIFGSVSVSDLEAFLVGTGVELQYGGFPLWLSIVLGAGGVLILVAVFFFLRRRKKAGHRVSASFKKGVPLEHYLESFPDKLNPKTVTSLMMPAALMLRDKHLRGELSLKLSPKYIHVTYKGCTISDHCEDDGFVQERFLAPEQLSHRAAGIYSDIYAFCAIMQYMLSKASLMTGAGELDDWLAVVEKGMAEVSEDRYASMQELIYALSPFNSGITRELFECSAVTRPAFSTLPAAASVPTTDPNVIYPAGADIPFPAEIDANVKPEQDKKKNAPWRLKSACRRVFLWLQPSYIRVSIIRVQGLASIGAILKRPIRF